LQREPSLSDVARQADVRRGQIYRWRREPRTATPVFAQVMIAPEPRRTPTTPVPSLEIEVGRDIRVRILSTTPIALASAVIKALAANSAGVMVMVVYREAPRRR
jgi:transposase